MVLDIAGQGVTLNNLWSGPGIPLGGSILMMAFDNVLYAFLAYYLDCVVPSKSLVFLIKLLNGGEGNLGEGVETRE